MLFEKITRLILNFIVMISIVRYLGPNQFGIYSYAISFYGLFVAFISLGMESISIRELVKYPEKRDEILGSVFYSQLLGAVLAISLIIIALFATGEEFYMSILIVIIAASSFFQTFNVIDYYFRSKVNAKFSVYVLLTSVLIVSIVKVFLIFLNSPLIGFIIAYSFEFVCNAIGYLLIYNSKINKLKYWRFDTNVFKNLLNDSWPLILSGMVGSIYMKIDQVMIKNMLDVKEVGYYAVAVKLSESWYFIPVAITNALFPAIINSKNINQDLYYSRLQKLYNLLAWIAIAISLPISFLSSSIINFLYGVEYLSAAPILTIYIWAGIAVFLGVASGQFLSTENLTKISFLRSFGGMIINVILNYILITKIGIIGSAVATLISYTLATFSIGLFKDSRKQFVMMIKSILGFDAIKIVVKRIRNER